MFGRSSAAVEVDASARMHRLTIATSRYFIGTPAVGTSTLNNISCALEAQRDNVQDLCMPAAWKTRVIDFGAGPVKAVTIPWGDVSTAYHSTGIPNIEVYTAAPLSLRLAARASRSFGWLLGSRLGQGLLRRRIRAGPPGPTEEERAQGRSYVWGEAVDNAGQRVVSRLQGPEG